MTSPPPSLTIARRYAGPPASGNGGYTAGRLAEFVEAPADRPITVSLRRPPPLDVALTVETDADDGMTRLMRGQDLVAEAHPGTFAADAVEPVSPADARSAESAYRGLTSHPFPHCFVCGTTRDPGDGLLLRPGLYAPGRAACVWRPHPSFADATGAVPAVYLWSALDCPAAWTSDLETRPLVLGRMTTMSQASVTPDAAYVIVARLLGEDGRKTSTATSAYDENGRLVGRAEHVWIAIDPADFS